ncbi:glycosyltransferase family 2 protein [bacterium]|nr:glycosyltransferase family 2 protein [bacterium]
MSDVNYPSISVVIPAYNEEATIAEIISRVRDIKIEKEIIVVNDGSKDSTLKILESLSGPDMRIITLPGNSGKGGAIREGFKHAKNDVVIIQDADLEYDPQDYYELIQPFVTDNADVVYGSRFITNKIRRLHFFWHYVANSMLTLACNMVSNLNMSDMETCYKVFKREHIQSIQLKEKRFGIEPEMTIKLARKKLRFYEVGISYHGRSYEEGKKIGAKDAIRALYCIIKYGLFS